MKLRYVCCLIVLVCALGGGLWLAPLPVNAAGTTTGCNSGPFEWCDWDIKIDFPLDNLRVIYTVRVGHYAAGNIPMVDQYASFDISESCRQQGEKITITNNVAHFAGGYYQCIRPSFADIVTDLTAGQIQLPAACTCKFPAAAFEGDFAAPGRHPLLYRNDGQFYVTMNRQALVTTTLHALSAATLPIDYNSNPWAMAGDARLWSGELGKGIIHFMNVQWSGANGSWFAFLQNPPAASAPDFMTATATDESFLHWSEGAQPTYQASQGAIQIETGSQPFYIGYDPVSDERFIGTMQKLWDDPGCFGSK